MARLTKLQSTHNRLRTDDVVGEYIALPKVGERFSFVGESLDPEIQALGGARLIQTSTVVNVSKDDNGHYVIETANSTYRLEV